MPTADDSFGNQGNLGRRFSLSEYHFRHALTHRPMVVDPRKVEVFVRGVPHRLEDPGMRLGGRDRSLLEFGEQSAQGRRRSCLSDFVGGVQRVAGRGQSGRRIDFTNLRGLDSLSYADGVGHHL